MSRSLPPNRIGTVIGGRYEVVSLLGQGGQSAVFRARDRRDGDEVALKILKAGADAESTERMFREARAMASLHGTSALRVLDQQWTSDGAMCLVTELLDGLSLEDLLEHTEKSGQRLDVPSVVRIFDPVIRTLSAAHEVDIVHRDLKPGNIFVLSGNRGVRLLDFGFAKFQRLRGLTADGMIAGSPTYIAPETWSGRKDLVNHRVDVYGIAAVIFRCLAGVPPFAAKDLIALLRDVTTSPRPKLSAFRADLPGAVDDWVELALAIDPNQRFQTVKASWRAFCSVVGE